MLSKKKAESERLAHVAGGWIVTTIVTWDWSSFKMKDWKGGRGEINSAQ